MSETTPAFLRLPERSPAPTCPGLSCALLRRPRTRSTPKVRAALLSPSIASPGSDNGAGPLCGRAGAALQIASPARRSAASLFMQPMQLGWPDEDH